MVIADNTVGVFDYKVIPVPLDDDLDDDELALIDVFNGRFNEEDIFLKAESDTIIVHLKRADMNLLRATVNELTDSHTQNGTSANLLKASLQAVEAIKSYGLEGKKRNYVGYNRERKVKNRSIKELRRGRHYYANDAQFSKTQNSPPAEYVNKIVVGDSLDVLSNLPDNCVDLVFTSPPYNFGLDYSESPDDHRWDDYFDQLFAIFDECIRVLKFGGRIAVNVQPLFSDYIPSHHIISDFFMQRHLIWKGEILWEKNNYNCKYTAWGSWKSPSSPYMKYTWEFIEIFCKGDLKHEGSQSEADISADEFKQWVNAKWSIAPERNMREYGHPAMFPEELANRILKLFSFRGAYVLDPFAGVGTTALAAKKSGRRYLGIDISPEYCGTAERRLSQILV